MILRAIATTFLLFLFSTIAISQGRPRTVSVQPGNDSKNTTEASGLSDSVKIDPDKYAKKLRITLEPVTIYSDENGKIEIGMGWECDGEDIETCEGDEDPFISIIYTSFKGKLGRLQNPKFSLFVDGKDVSFLSWSSNRTYVESLDTATSEIFIARLQYLDADEVRLFGPSHPDKLYQAKQIDIEAPAFPGRLGRVRWSASPTYFTGVRDFLEITGALSSASSLSSLTHNSSGLATSSGPKTVYVRSYVRKDGTVVRSHMRSRPGSGTSAKKPSRRKI